MPEIPGRLRTPRLTTAPASPVAGEMYYDTAQNKLYWFDGSVWQPASGPTIQDEGVALPPRSGLNFVGPTLSATDDSANNRIVISNAIPRVVAVPASPIDGQECYLVGPANPNTGETPLWHMRYNTAATKWEFLGGSPWTANIEGANAGYVGITNGSAFTVNAAQSAYLGVQTPIWPLPVFCEATWFVGLVQKMDAAYHYGTATATCSPAAYQGSNETVYKTQHASVQQFDYYTVTKRWVMMGSTQHLLSFVWSSSGGTWQYYQGPTYIWFQARAWPR